MPWRLCSATISLSTISVADSMKAACAKGGQADVRQLQVDQHERTVRAARGVTTGYDYRSDVLTAPGTLLCMALSWPVVGK